MKHLLLGLALSALATLSAPPRPALADDLGPGDSFALPGDGDGADTPKPCGLGRKVLCATTTTQTCTEWKYQPNISVSPTGGGAGYTLVCANWVTRVSYQYKD